MNGFVKTAINCLVAGAASIVGSEVAKKAMDKETYDFVKKGKKKNKQKEKEAIEGT